MRRLAVLFVLLLLVACGGEATTGSAPEAAGVSAEVGKPHEDDGHSHDHEDDHSHDEAVVADVDEHSHEDETHSHDDESASHEEMEMAHEEDGQHTHGDAGQMAEAHGIPAEAALVANPSPPTEETVQIGAAAFEANCATCHGPLGAGDGPAAVALDPMPADLRDSHVQGLSDGALFYVITNGREGTAMPAWEGTLDEETRWSIVRFLRTLAGQ